MFSRLEIDFNTRLIRYSCRVGFLLKYLPEHTDIKIKHFVLAAHYPDPNRELGTYFDNLILDKKLPERIGKI